MGARNTGGERGAHLGIRNGEGVSGLCKFYL